MSPTSAAAAHDTSSSPLRLTLAQIRSLVQSWLAGAAGEASSLKIAELSNSGDTVNVTIDGPSAPLSAIQLAQAISKQAGHPVTVSVNWQITPATATPPASTGNPPSSEQVRAAATTWLAAHPGPEILNVSLAGGTATIDPAGTSPTQVTPGLWTALQAQLPDVNIVIRFAQLKTLTP